MISKKSFPQVPWKIAARHTTHRITAQDSLRSVKVRYSLQPHWIDPHSSLEVLPFLAPRSVVLVCEFFLVSLDQRVGCFPFIRQLERPRFVTYHRGNGREGQDDWDSSGSKRARLQDLSTCWEVQRGSQRHQEGREEEQHRQCQRRYGRPSGCSRTISC